MASFSVIRVNPNTPSDNENLALHALLVWEKAISPRFAIAGLFQSSLVKFVALERCHFSLASTMKGAGRFGYPRCVVVIGPGAYAP